MTAFIMVAVYLGLTCIISLINKNRQSSTRNTFVAKNGMSACTLIPLLFGELIAGAGTVGNASEAFTHGITAVWGNWGQAIGCMVFVVYGRPAGIPSDILDAVCCGRVDSGADNTFRGGYK